MLGMTFRFLVGGLALASVAWAGDEALIFQQWDLRLEGRGYHSVELTPSIEVHSIQFSTKDCDCDVRGVTWNGSELSTNVDNPRYWEARDRSPLRSPGRLDIRIGGNATGTLKLRAHGRVPHPQDDSMARQAQSMFDQMMGGNESDAPQSGDNSMLVKRSGNFLYVADLRFNKGSIRSRLDIDQLIENEQRSARARSSRSYQSRSARAGGVMTSSLYRDSAGSGSGSSLDSSVPRDGETRRIPAADFKATVENWMKLDRSLNIVIMQDMRYNMGSIDNRITARNSVRNAQGKNARVSSDTPRPRSAPAPSYLPLVAPQPQVIYLQPQPTYYYTLPATPVYWCYPR